MGLDSNSDIGTRQTLKAFIQAELNKVREEERERIEEIIGEDEDTISMVRNAIDHNIDYDQELFMRAEARNNLRDDQRQALSTLKQELLGKE